MTFDATTTATLIIIAIAGREVIGLAIRAFWKKTVSTDYLTVEQAEALVTAAACKECRDECEKGRKASWHGINEKLDEHANDLKTVKGLLLIWAGKNGVELSELKGLM